MADLHRVMPPIPGKNTHDPCRSNRAVNAAVAVRQRGRSGGEEAFQKRLTQKRKPMTDFTSQGSLDVMQWPRLNPSSHAEPISMPTPPKAGDEHSIRGADGASLRPPRSSRSSRRGAV